MSDLELSEINDDDEIVRQYENEDDDDAERQENDEDVDVTNEEVKADGEDTDKKPDVPTKKRHTRKMYVLNTERLKGLKGIHTIEKLYEGFKFKGKGHEKEDLDRVMKRLEYWAFRLFPKLDFDDFLEKCEHLGHKKDLQTHLKKYRLDMITADDMYTQNEIIDDDRDDDADIARRESELQAEINDDVFQRLLNETDAAQQIL